MCPRLWQGPPQLDFALSACSRLVIESSDITDPGAEISARRCNFHFRCMLVGLLVVLLLIFHYTG